jgi:hypothetical protein
MPSAKKFKMEEVSTTTAITKGTTTTPVPPGTIQDSIQKMTKACADGIAGQANSTAPNTQLLSTYNSLLQSISALEKSLPLTQEISFTLEWREVLVLLAWGVGGLLIMGGALLFFPAANWTGADLANVLLYWSGIVAVLLGVQTLPQFGKGGSSSSSAGSSQM